LRWFGFFFFIVSFVTPTRDFKTMGFGAFVAAAQTIYEMCQDGSTWHHWGSLIIFIALCLGWLSNFSVFFRLPKAAALIMIAAPWLLFLTMTTLGSLSGLVAFIPFYPWAIGIGLIHYGRILEKRRILPADFQAEPASRSH
jgi:hypothetical protein